MSVSEASRSTAVDAQPPAPQLTANNRTALNRDYVVAIAVGVAFLPFLTLLGLHLWARPHYQFFPIVLIGFILLVRSRWSEADEIISAPRKRWLTFQRRLPSALLLLGWLLLGSAVAVFSPWLAGIAALFATASLLMHFVGPGGFHRFIGPWCLLLLIIPLPFQLDSRLIQWLQATDIPTRRHVAGSNGHPASDGGKHSGIPRTSDAG